MRLNIDLNIEMNFMPAADSRFFFFFFIYRAYGWCRRLNIDLNIEMNFMPTADSRFLMYGLMDVYEIESRFEYRNEYHACSRFAMFYVWEYA